MGIQKQKSCFTCYSPHTIGILNALGAEQEREITEIAEADFLAFEELLSHAIHGDVEDGGDLGLHEIKVLLLRILTLLLSLVDA